MKISFSQWLEETENPQPWQIAFARAIEETDAISLVPVAKKQGRAWLMQKVKEYKEATSVQIRPSIGSHSHTIRNHHDGVVRKESFLTFCEESLKPFGVKPRRNHAKDD